MEQHQHVTVIQPSSFGCIGKRPTTFVCNDSSMSTSPGGPGVCNPVESSMCSFSVDRGRDLSDDPINDALLLQLPVRDLNKRLQGISKEEVLKLKQKRRTLKNRGYAQSCRTKRMNQRIELEKSNQALMGEMQKMRVELSRVIVERDMYKQKLAALTAARESIALMDSDHSNSPERYR